MTLFIAYLDRVVDGDTFDCHVELAPFISGMIKARIRLDGVQAPEMDAMSGGRPDLPTRERARAARDWLKDHLQVAGYLILMARTHDSFGRVLAEVCVGGESICQAMIAAGHAVPFKR